VAALEGDLRGGLGDLDAADDVAVDGRRAPGLVVVADAGRGEEDRLEEGLAAELRADLREVGADLLALAIDDVAGDAFGDPLEDRLAPSRVSPRPEHHGQRR